MVELDFSQLGINYIGQNAFVTTQPGEVDVILKSFGHEVARRTFSYHFDMSNSARLTNPGDVKSWILTFDGVDEFVAELSDVQANASPGQASLTTTLSYASSAIASSTYATGGLNTPAPIIDIGQ